MALIEAAGVHVRFGDRVVLESIDLAVPEGEFHGMMGPNGAGKTTFFNVLTGRVKPSRGERSGSTARTSPACSSHRIAAQGRRALVPDHDAVRRIHRARERHGRSARVSRPRLRHAPRRRRRSRLSPKARWKSSPTVGLADKADIRAKDLSYGDRRALEIAVALAQSPRVLCLDEPTSGLGSDGVQRLAALVGRLKGKLTIVAIEHDMEFLFSLADRISVIHWGQVVARGTPHELQQNEWVKRSNLGRFA